MSGERRTRLAAAAAITAALCLGVASPALAAKPPGKGKPSASSTTESTTATGFTVDDGTYGGTTTAHNNSTSRKTSGSNLWVHAMCYQGNDWVFGQWVALDTDGTAQIELGPTPAWDGGSADCVADLAKWKNGRWQTLDSTTFSVSASTAPGSIV